jgi:hypothetical protein
MPSFNNLSRPRRRDLLLRQKRRRESGGRRFRPLSGGPLGLWSMKHYTRDGHLTTTIGLPTLELWVRPHPPGQRVEDLVAEYGGGRMSPRSKSLHRPLARREKTSVKKDFPQHLPQNRRCPRCERRKPLDAFPPNRKRRDGRSSWCRECHNEAVQRWRAENPDRVEAYNRARRTLRTA